MRTVVQRVTSASVCVDGEEKGRVGKGLLVFVGIKTDDTEDEVLWMANKIRKLRVFEDESGKMNLSTEDIKGGFLIISQFTLYGDCQRGTRPSFSDAAAPGHAVPLYERFIELIKESGLPVGTGVFGADMKIRADNDGPVTIILERDHAEV